MTERTVAVVGHRLILLMGLMGMSVLFSSSGCRAQVDNKILKQSTLYEFHFRENGSQLNTVGRYDLDVLLTRFKGYSGKMRIQQGEASPELYSTRIQAVVDALIRAGVDEDRISVVEVEPDSERPPGERDIVILSDDDQGVGSHR